MSFPDTTISRWLKRAESIVSIYTILAGIAGFGIGSYFYDLLHGFYLSLGVFGAVGALDIFHRQRKAEINTRCQPLRKSDLFWDLRLQKPEWKPKMIQEFKHCGLRFTAFGFQEEPAARFVSFPLCPSCGGKLAQRGYFAFPYRQRFQFFCKCGFAKVSKVSLGELQREAEDLGNAVKQTD